MISNVTLHRLLLSMFVLALFGGSIIIMSFFDIPEKNRDVVFQLTGGINTIAGMVIGWYFRATMNTDRPKDEEEVH